MKIIFSNNFIATLNQHIQINISCTLKSDDYKFVYTKNVIILLIMIFECRK